MVKKTVILVLISLAVSPAHASPRGLSGIGLGFGGIFSDGSAAFVQGEFDFEIPPYVSIGPELGGVFGGGTGLLTGGEVRVYLIPHFNYITQPFTAFGGGLLIDFEDETDVLGYLQFGGGLDIEIPDTPIIPYGAMGGFVMFTGGGSAACFKLEGGLRFDLF